MGFPSLAVHKNPLWVFVKIRSQGPPFTYWRSVRVYNPWVCLKTTSPSAAGTHWAWNLYLRLLTFLTNWSHRVWAVKPPTLLFPWEWGASIVPWEKGSGKVPGCFKIQTSGPSWHFPAAQGKCCYTQAETRWPGDQGRLSHPSCPTFSFLRSQSGDTPVRQLSSYQERDVLVCVSINSSTQLVSHRAWGQEFSNSLVSITELTSQHPREGRANRRLVRWGYERLWVIWQMGICSPDRETEKTYLYFDLYLFMRRFRLKEVLRGLPWVKQC